MYPMCSSHQKHAFDNPAGPYNALLAQRFMAITKLATAADVSEKEEAGAVEEEQETEVCHWSVVFVRGCWLVRGYGKGEEDPGGL